jgi:bile-salt sulfotransferase
MRKNIRILIKFIKRKTYNTLPIKPDYAGKYLKVFSHPRSGTHFIEAFIAKNFYENHDFYPREGKWGHWANRVKNPGTNIHFKLFGSHSFPYRSFFKINYPSVYIYRDGRSVAYSIWKTDNFLHPQHKNISFSDFLRLKLDWEGGPGNKKKPRFNIAQHWEGHVGGWLDIASKNDNILVIRYEDLVENPSIIYYKIHEAFFSEKQEKKPEDIIKINKPIGLKPNKGTVDSWKDAFNHEDIAFFYSQLKDQRLISYLRENDEKSI